MYRRQCTEAIRLHKVNHKDCGGKTWKLRKENFRRWKWQQYNCEFPKLLHTINREYRRAKLKLTKIYRERTRFSQIRLCMCAQTSNTHLPQHQGCRSKYIEEAESLMNVKKQISPKGSTFSMNTQQSNLETKWGCIQLHIDMVKYNELWHVIKYHQQNFLQWYSVSAMASTLAMSQLYVAIVNICNIASTEEESNVWFLFEFNFK